MSLHYPFTAKHTDCKECDREYEPPPNCIHRIGMGGVCPQCDVEKPHTATNTTNEHKEQARRLAESVHIGAGCSCGVNSPTYICLAHEAIEHAIIAYANQRNTEIREVLEGLITCTLDEGDGPQLHWCPIGEDSDMECGPSCLAAARLYAKLQPDEKS